MKRIPLATIALTVANLAAAQDAEAVRTLFKNVNIYDGVTLN